MPCPQGVFICYDNILKRQSRFLFNAERHFLWQLDGSDNMIVKMAKDDTPATYPNFTSTAAAISTWTYVVAPATDGRRRSPSTRIPGPCVTQNNVLMVDKSSYNAYIGVLRATSTYTEKFSGSFMSSVYSRKYIRAQRGTTKQRFPPLLAILLSALQPLSMWGNIFTDYGGSGADCAGTSATMGACVPGLRDRD